MTAGSAPLLRGRREAGFLLFLLLAGAVVHLLYFGEARQSPFFEKPVLDEAIHYEWATTIASGGKWQEGEPFFRAPLYPLLLALILKAGGAGFVLPALVQILLTIWNPVLLYLLARELFPRTIAATAALALLAYGMVFYFDVSLLIVSILLPLDLLFLYLLVRAARSGENGPAWPAAGLVLGLSAIARPNILLFAVTVPVWMALLPRPAGSSFRGRIVPFVIGMLLPITPVFLHNLAAGEPVLIAWQGGTNFYIGNNPESDGMTAIAPGTDGTWWGGYNDLIHIAESAEGRPLKRMEVSRYWFGQAVRFITGDPGAAMRLYAKKIYVLLGDFEVSNNQGIYFLRQYSRTLRWGTLFSFGLLFPLAVAGMMTARWTRYRMILALFLITYSASIVLFFVTARYRMPLIPLLILFAAVALQRFVETIRRKKNIKRLLIPLTGFLLAALLSNSNLLGLERDKFTQGYYNLGVVFLTGHDYEKATPWFEKAIEEEPEYRNARYNLALCHSYTGRLEEARIQLEILINQAPEFAEARESLGTIYARLGEPDRAILHLSESIRLRPDNGAAILSRGMVLYDQKRMDEGLSDMERGIRLLSRQGKSEEAAWWIERLGRGGVAGVVLERLRTMLVPQRD